MLKVGLIDVDSHNFPNVAVMKLSAYHKSRGDAVEWWDGFKHYDIVYKSRVFTDSYTTDHVTAINADCVICGGTGYDLHSELSGEIEQQYPDYGMYPQFSHNAYGFLTRGCPRGCSFCIVSEKEGRISRQVADISEFCRGQREIKLLDPNILACTEHEKLLEQLSGSGAWVDFTQGLDIRLVTPDNATLLNRIKIKCVHFAWDNPKQDLTADFQRYMSLAKPNKHRKPGVYVLTNFGSTQDEDLERIYTLRDLGYDPYVMIYNKPSAPRQTRDLQRWCNNRIIFNVQPDFAKYDPSRGYGVAE